MSNNIRLEVGKNYLTRDGRVVEIVAVTGLAYPYRGVLVDSGRYRNWLADGSYIGYGETDDLDLVSEYVETPAYRFFKYKDSERLCFWRHDPRYDHISDSKFLDEPGDKWVTVPVSLTDNAEDPDMVECDENGVPLSPPPAPEPRIPEGFIEVARVYNIFNKDYLTKVLLRVSDIASVHEGAERCTIKTVSGTHDYPVSESYTTVLEKINAALP